MCWLPGTSVSDLHAFYVDPNPVKNLSADPDTDQDPAHRKCKGSFRDIVITLPGLQIFKGLKLYYFIFNT
jgi:hypothetical protein